MTVPIELNRATRQRHEVWCADTAQLLLSGGDSRLQLDPRTGCTKYGCTPVPCGDILSFGSCTASSVSGLGFRAAVLGYRGLQAAGPGNARIQVLDDAYEKIRQQLRSLLTLGHVPGVEVVLTPSGTDAELIALALVSGNGSVPVCNIIVGPSEVGSGTALAAGCRYFDTVLPNGCSERERPPVSGEAVDEELAARTRVERVWLRESSGAVRSSEDVDAEVSDLVRREIYQGSRVLLHIVAHSKTGVHAPSLPAVAALRQQFGEQLSVIIDAAQGRFSRRGLVEVLKRGYLILITGSKFFGGPAFAGALLVPENLQPHRHCLSTLPHRFGDFFNASQLPRNWRPLRDRLPAADHPGLALRWQAALAHMREYYASPSLLRLHVLRAFERLVPEIFGRSLQLRLASVSPPVFADDEERLLESKTTVFPLAVRRGRAAPREYNYEELQKIFRWMYQDVSHLVPTARPDIRRRLATKLQIGQPVALGPSKVSGPAMLRIALSGVQIVQIGVDPRCGATLQERIAYLAKGLNLVREKLELIAIHFETLAAAETALAAYDSTSWILGKKKSA